MRNFNLREGETSVSLCKPETFYFFNCEAETSKCSKCEHESFRHK